MIGIIASAILVSGLFAAQAAPTTLQTEQTTSPPAVTDHLPEFRFLNSSGFTVNRFQIQVTTNSALLPTSPDTMITHWNSAGMPNGTAFPGGANLANNGTTPEIPYGQGTSPLTAVPLLDWNTVFYWRAKVRRSTGGGNWSPFSATAQFTMAAPTRAIAQHSNNGSASGASWRVIGVPIAIGTTVPATELLTEVPLMYRLDEPTRTWTQLTAADTLQGGRGYLAWCDANAVLTLSQGKVMAGIPATIDGLGVTTTPSYNYTNSFTYTLLGAPAGQEITDGVPANSYAGNHLFANPFYAPISWRSSTQPPVGSPFGHMARAGISFAMYKWNGTQYLTYNSQTDTGNAGDTIEPFQAVGIWVQDANNTLWINTPAPLTGGSQKSTFATSAAATPPAPDADRWRLMIEARSGAAIDTENAFGIDPQADDAWDVRDSEEPGAGSPSWVLVSIDHRSDWTKYPRKYTHDFKKTPTRAGDEVVWTFMVDGNTGLPATLTWPNLADIPAGEWTFTLEDPATSTVLDLSTASSYDTQAVNGPSTMTLRATRLKDAPTSAPTGGSSGGGGCGLLGLDGILLAAALLARRLRR